MTAPKNKMCMEGQIRFSIATKSKRLIRVLSEAEVLHGNFRSLTYLPTNLYLHLGVNFPDGKELRFFKATHNEMDPYLGVADICHYQYSKEFLDLAEGIAKPYADKLVNELKKISKEW